MEGLVSSKPTERHVRSGGAMSPNHEEVGLQLTEEEAHGLLAMCLTSPHKLDNVCESGLRKLAQYCIKLSNHSETIPLEIIANDASGS
jgi:hypothetical protein